MMFYVLVVVVPLAIACGPGSGAVTDKPTMKFNYSSPLAWTYNEPASGGQSLNKNTAQNRINADIELAVIKAVESYGYSTAGVKVANAVVAGGPFKISPDGKCAVPDAAGVKTYVQQNGVVLYECILATMTPAELNDLTKAKPARHDGTTITITSPVALAQSNWENIATKVWASLSNDAGVKFYGLIEVQAK